MSRVLFVSHQASRSGAPLVLLHLLRWLREHSDLESEVLLLEGGELQAEFAALGAVTAVQGNRGLVARIGWSETALAPVPRDIPRLERSLRLPARRAVLRALRRRIGRPDVVYLNSAFAAPALRVVPAGVPVLAHVHESDFMLAQLQRERPWAFELLLARTSRYIAAAEVVAAALRRAGVAGDLIDVCHSFIPLENPDGGEPQLPRARATPLVGCVATIDWLKGPDLFVALARAVKHRYDGDVSFVWVGGARAGDSWSEPQIAHDVRAAGLEGCVSFMGSRPDARAAIADFDLFVLTSRSESFPLVCLEAAAAEKPIVCFDAGGMGELLDPDQRLVVPYLDIDAMAARVCELLDAPEQRAAIGSALAQRVRERHSVDLVAPAILELIRALDG